MKFEGVVPAFPAQPARADASEGRGQVPNEEGIDPHGSGADGASDKRRK